MTTKIATPGLRHREADDDRALFESHFAHLQEHEDDATEDTVSNPDVRRPMAGLIAARLSRRQALGGMIASGAVLGAAGLIGGTFASRPALAVGTAESTLGFRELAHGYDETLHVAEGYEAQVLLRWGDPIASDAPAFDSANLEATDQLRQFGYNNDFIGYLPLPAGSNSSTHGLLCVNHEYTNAELMWPGIDADDKSKMSRDQAEYEMAAHGHSVVEIRKAGGAWEVVRDSRYNRRITALETGMRLSGPAAGHERLKTSADPTGMQVIGTLNNCAGGVTPWGTVLFAEENIQHYFGGPYLTKHVVRDGETLDHIARNVSLKTGGRFTSYDIARLNKLHHAIMLIPGRT